MDKVKMFLKDNIKYLTFFLAVIVIIGTNIMVSYYFYQKNFQLVDNKYTSNDFLETEVVDKPKIFKVDIKGEVNKPGTYEIDEGKRVIDVIELAQGLTNKADTKVNNLSLKVYDEMVIIIYSKDEVTKFSETIEKENQIIKNCLTTTNGIKNDSCIIKENIDLNDDESTIKETKISINKADVAKLMEIPGIGEAKAKSIINYRNDNGYFKTIEEIKNVTGVGEALYDKIKDYITV